MAGLPPEFVEEAINQGQKLDLWPTITELLDILPEFGWNVDLINQPQPPHAPYETDHDVDQSE
jgi:hypothetical protein